MLLLMSYVQRHSGRLEASSRAAPEQISKRQSRCLHRRSTVEKSIKSMADCNHTEATILKHGTQLGSVKNRGSAVCKPESLVSFTLLSIYTYLGILQQLFIVLACSCACLLATHAGPEMVPQAGVGVSV